MPSRMSPNTQLSLFVDSPPRPVPIKVPEEAVSVLADLLLAAVGGRVDPKRMESGDEQQDHR
jgi:hypothetical protein